MMPPMGPRDPDDERWLMAGGIVLLACVVLGLLFLLHLAFGFRGPLAVILGAGLLWAITYEIKKRLP